MNERCALCERDGVRLTRHHLIPLTRQRNRRMRRAFSAAEMQSEILRLCAPCHRQLHQLIGEKELALRYNTLERLRAHPELARFVRWIRDRPVDLKPRGRSWRRRQRRG